MIRDIRNLGRAFGIVRILGHYGASSVVDDLPLPKITKLFFWMASRKPSKSVISLRQGQRLAAATQALGPSFIKFGQALSTRPDLVGEEVASDLANFGIGYLLFQELRLEK